MPQALTEHSAGGIYTNARCLPAWMVYHGDIPHSDWQMSMAKANQTTKGMPGHELGLQEVLDWLIEDGRISADEAGQLASLQKFSLSKRHPFKVIEEFYRDGTKASGKDMTQAGLTHWLGERLGLEVVTINPLKVNVAQVTALMSMAYAKNFSILPLEVNGDVVTIATSQPLRTDWEDELDRLLHKQFKRVLATPDEIERYTLEFFSISKSVFEAREEKGGRSGSGIQNLEQLMEMGKSGKLDANDHHVVSIVDWLLQYAFEQRASDIHVEPRRDTGYIRFRIDGVMHQVYELPPGVMAAVTSRIKILGRMDVAEKRRPQDGRMKTRTPDGVELELRLSTMPTAFGEKMVMRIFDPEVLVKGFAEMGFSPSDEQFWSELVRQPNGIILLTGPTGSGKTTTLYSTLKMLAKPEVNVCTVEDPIEMVDPALNQMQVQHGIGVDFAAGIRTLLRQDPDIIMVGEIRDGETAEMAVQAALTGHLVFSTLHTNDAPSAISRLMDIGVQPYMINSVLLAVVAQRLVRKLCPHCKEAVEFPDDEWKQLIHPFKSEKPKKVYRAVGCTECRHTGYSGRTGIYEMMDYSSSIQGMVTRGANMHDLRKQALKEGMKALRLAGLQKVADGVTSIEEVVRVTPVALEE